MALLAASALAAGCGGAGDTCVPGRSIACTCAGGSPGAALCSPEGIEGACECAGGGGSGQSDAAGDACVPSDESCDGADNDCDRVADEGEVCPVETVQGTRPFTAGLYLVGTLSPGSCSADAIQRFWPTVSEEYITNLPCEAMAYDFRPGDGALLYVDYRTGVNVDTDPSGDDGDQIIRTPPCGIDVGWPLGFDDDDTLHYLCGDTVRRRDGDLIRFPVYLHVATLADGRILTWERSEEREYVVASDPQGRELSRVPPDDAFDNPLAPLFRGTTVAGDRAYVLLARDIEADAVELVAYALDEESSWTQMRRVTIADRGDRQVVISDGTVFIRDRDPEVAFNDQIVAHRPDGSTAIVWREAESEPVKSHGPADMIVGPP